MKSAGSAGIDCASSYKLRSIQLQTLPPGRQGVRHIHEVEHARHARSEEHTSELQSHVNLVCRLLLEKKVARVLPDLGRVLVGGINLRRKRQRPTKRGQKGQVISLFFFNDTATTEIYTLSLHDALPICAPCGRRPARACPSGKGPSSVRRRGARFPPAPRSRRGPRSHRPWWERGCRNTRSDATIAAVRRCRWGAPGTRGASRCCLRPKNACSWCNLLGG